MQMYVNNTFSMLIADSGISASDVMCKLDRALPLLVRAVRFWLISWLLSSHACINMCNRRIRIGNPPTNSAYWRWHHAGDGCVSTIEATYFVLLEYMGESKHDASFMNACAVSNMQY
jgi:hypothetical protein